MSEIVVANLPAAMPFHANQFWQPFFN